MASRVGSTSPEDRVGWMLAGLARRTKAQYLEVPRRVGPFWMQALIGEGGQGTVGFATLDLHGQYAPMVLKVFKGDAASDWPRITRSLEHQLLLSREGACPPVIGAEPRGEPPWVAQEPFGRSLAHIIDDRGPISALTACRVAEGLARALGTAHRHQIVHRDIKPSNVLCRGYWSIALCDFDLAKAAGDTTVTPSGAIVGTQLYASPEQLLGQRASTASDVFSSAATLLYVVTGDIPHLAADNYLNPDQPAKLLAGPREALLGLAKWVEQALRWRPSERPSMDELEELASDVRRELRGGSPHKPG